MNQVLGKSAFRLSPTMAATLLSMQVSDLLRVVQDIRNRGLHGRTILVPYEKRRVARVLRVEVSPEGFTVYGAQ